MEKLQSLLNRVKSIDLEINPHIRDGVTVEEYFKNYKDTTLKDLITDIRDGKDGFLETMVNEDKIIILKCYTGQKIYHKFTTIGYDLDNVVSSMMSILDQRGIKIK